MNNDERLSQVRLFLFKKVMILKYLSIFKYKNKLRSEKQKVFLSRQDIISRIRNIPIIVI